MDGTIGDANDTAARTDAAADGIAAGAAAGNATILADLLAQRMCHDLSGPLGALMGVVEMACHEAPESETLAVADQTARSLAARLRLLRAAWGGDSLPETVADLLALAPGLPHRRVALEADALFGMTLTPALARVLVNVVLLAAEALPSGGRITLANAGGGEVVVAIQGARAAWPTGLLGALADPPAALAALDSPRQLQAPMTALLARAGGIRLTVMHAAAANGTPPPLLVSPAG